MNIEISKDEYFDIFNKNKDKLCVHASYTDISGDGYQWSSGYPQWMTEWGFKDSENPLIRAESEIDEGETIHKYYKVENN